MKINGNHTFQKIIWFKVIYCSLLVGCIIVILFFLEKLQLGILKSVIEKENTISLINMFSTIEKGLFLLLFFVLLITFFEIYFIKKNIINPISLIADSLETGSKKSIRILKTMSGTFGEIGSLFQSSDNQKFELLTAKTNAEKSERLKTIFLENLSHEIRTPLNAVIGFSELMMTDTIDENEKKEYLTIIHKSGKNLVSIIEDLIELSKIDTNQVTPNYSDLDIEKCLVELYTTINVNIENSKNIDFYIKESNSKLSYNIKADEVKLKQVLTNLINNSLKYTHIGHVCFGYEVVEEGELEFIEFTIEDTGIGISKEHQKVIFDRFKRVESDLAIEKGGLGLGLAISKAYVEMMGGTISIQSSEGKGTAFIFKVPLKYNKKEVIEVIESIDNYSSLASKKTILIAEDDNINFILIKKMLQITKHEIIRAKNGKIAVDIAMSNENIDLVLMDIKMPIMNGYEAFEKIKEVYPNLPIIAQTAHASEEDKNKVMTMGFTNFITKPINKSLLLEMVAAHS